MTKRYVETVTLSEKQMQEIFGRVFKAIKAAGYKVVPLEPDKKMLDKGEYVNSEWLNDNAPINQRMYRAPAEAVYKAMIGEVAVGDVMIPCETSDD